MSDDSLKICEICIQTYINSSSPIIVRIHTKVTVMKTIDLLHEMYVPISTTVTKVYC